jgi:hypothetical protein
MGALRREAKSIAVVEPIGCGKKGSQAFTGLYRDLRLLLGFQRGCAMVFKGFTGCRDVRNEPPIYGEFAVRR